MKFFLIDASSFILSAYLSSFIVCDRPIKRVNKRMQRGRRNIELFKRKQCGLIFYINSENKMAGLAVAQP